MELNKGTKGQIKVDPDNPPDEQMMRICPIKSQHVLNPIIDWTTDEVWEFIHEYSIPYCKLYDEGYKRLGCIGCPMSTHAREELERYPKLKRAYLKAFERMLEIDKQREGWAEKHPDWQTAEDVMTWWLETDRERKERRKNAQSV